MKQGKTLFQSLFVLVLISAVFIFSYNPVQESQTASGITNYYYYQGQRFYLNERTDMVFAQFKPGLTEQQARQRLQAFPEVDASKTIETNRANFIPLRQRLAGDRYLALVGRMKQSDDFVFVGYAFSPLNVDDGKTFFGMSH